MSPSWCDRLLPVTQLDKECVQHHMGCSRSFEEAKPIWFSSDKRPGRKLAHYELFASVPSMSLSFEASCPSWRGRLWQYRLRTGCHPVSFWQKCLIFPPFYLFLWPFLTFVPPIDIWKKCIDLRLFSKYLRVPFLRSLRSPRSNNLETQNDENSKSKLIKK